jgi:hypothetical protein
MRFAAGRATSRARELRRAGAGAQVCAHDIEEVCVYERDSLDNIEGFDARVITCLQVRPCGRPRARARAAAACIAARSRATWWRGGARAAQETGARPALNCERQTRRCVTAASRRLAGAV